MINRRIARRDRVLELPGHANPVHLYYAVFIDGLPSGLPEILGIALLPKVLQLCIIKRLTFTRVIIGLGGHLSS